MSSSPSPIRGPTAWITCLAFRLPAPVITAVPTGVPPIRSHSSCIGGAALALDRSGHPAAQLQLLVGGVDDGVDVELGDVPLDQLELGVVHVNQMRFLLVSA